LSDLGLTWLGQAGFRLELDGLRVLVDPFLSDHKARLYPPPPRGAAVRNVDWVLVTHDHIDHFDRVAELAVPSLHILLPARNVEVVLAPFR